MGIPFAFVLQPDELKHVRLKGFIVYMLNMKGLRRMCTSILFTILLRPHEFSNGIRA